MEFISGNISDNAVEVLDHYFKVGPKIGLKQQ
jgi:hypothetical protein